jgi:hypothetical protein
MAKHAVRVHPKPESTLILILSLPQTTLPLPPLRRMPLPLPPLLLPTRQRSQRVPELRMLHWDGSDVWLLGCVSLGGASGWRVRIWLADGR